MARGLKISHERSDGTLVDQAVSTTISSIGATGGRPQWITVQGVKTVKVQFRDAAGVLHANAYIIAQKGAKQFLVANAVGATESHTHTNASVTICTLAAGTDAANAAPSASASTMVVTGVNTAGTSFYASRLSNKFVWDQSNTRYRYRNSDNLATAIFANVSVH